MFEKLVKTYRTCDSAPFVFDLVIEACVRSNRVDQAVEIVGMLRRRVYCDDGRMGEAMRVWEEMKDNGLKCDVMGYNTMIAGFCEAGDVNKAEEFFKEMGLNVVESSCVMYERLISSYCKVKDVDSAMLLYKDMCRKGSVAVGFVVDLLVKLLCEKGMITEGLKVSRFAKKNNVCMKGESYEVLIKGLGDEGRMEEAMKLQAEMVGRGFEPNLGIYGAFIGNMEMAGKLSSELLELK
ncbi:tetratricopeptide repeat (TPR)-like superfamily protein [Artemisia annua]|uniref:Tetratricopeptide repeat (TPR)-like superfamily protein n=1 Tax=Artemisia annua TaxID=35608 RepID=A0A2U1MBT9_ARTAN|nr:tetratricopeptide repeat (TPR)-like superfamily protein [Artemisia annua]